MPDFSMKRGFSYAEALVYLGIKRRTFDEVWRPRLVAISQGSSLIFDRHDLDRLFDEFKAQAGGAPMGGASEQAKLPGGLQKALAAPSKQTAQRHAAKPLASREILDFDTVVERILNRKKKRKASDLRAASGGGLPDQSEAD